MDPPVAPESIPESPGDSSDLKRADAASRGNQTFDAKKAFIVAMDKCLGQGSIA